MDTLHLLAKYRIYIFFVNLINIYVRAIYKNQKNTLFLLVLVPLLLNMGNLPNLLDKHELKYKPHVLSLPVVLQYYEQIFATPPSA